MKTVVLLSLGMLLTLQVAAQPPPVAVPSAGIDPVVFVVTSVCSLVLSIVSIVVALYRDQQRFNRAQIVAAQNRAWDIDERERIATELGAQVEASRQLLTDNHAAHEQRALRRVAALSDKIDGNTKVSTDAFVESNHANIKIADTNARIAEVVRQLVLVERDVTNQAAEAYRNRKIAESRQTTHLETLGRLEQTTLETLRLVTREAPEIPETVLDIQGDRMKDD